MFSYLKGDPSIEVFWEKQGTPAHHYLPGIGLGVYFELMGQPCLHADGLSYSDKGFALLGSSTAGKSTLSMSLAQQGCKILTDDMVVLRPQEGAWHIWPSLPALRLWPDSIARLLDADAVPEFKKVHETGGKRLLEGDRVAGLFAPSSAELSVFYVLDRHEMTDRPLVEIKPLSPVDGLITLLRESILSDATAVLGLETSRLKTLASVLETVDVRVVSYRSSHDNLSVVSKCIIEDIDRVRLTT